MTMGTEHVADGVGVEKLGYLSHELKDGGYVSFHYFHHRRAEHAIVFRRLALLERCNHRGSPHRPRYSTEGPFEDDGYFVITRSSWHPGDNVCAILTVMESAKLVHSSSRARQPQSYLRQAITRGQQTMPPPPYGIALGLGIQFSRPETSLTATLDFCTSSRDLSS